eukprot:m.15675 g.15675  ORF g.15675 m.15675 type:complete len:54 (-) comp5465_c0_seq2:34-195(-)
MIKSPFRKSALAERESFTVQKTTISGREGSDPGPLPPANLHHYHVQRLYKTGC